MHKNLPNGLKVSLELFRVSGCWFRVGIEQRRVFSRVDRVEHVEVDEFNHEIHETHEN